MDDPVLISHVQQTVLVAPSKLPYNLVNPKRKDFSEGSEMTNNIFPFLNVRKSDSR
jgi:hypothetical protein